MTRERTTVGTGDETDEGGSGGETQRFLDPCCDLRLWTRDTGVDRT